MDPALPTGGADVTAANSPYARLHQSPDVGLDYDERIYAAGSRDEFVWSLQRPVLERLARQLRAANDRVKYLDFACGTGRIVGALEALVDDPTGVDISPYMIERARPKAPRSRLVVADVLADPEAIDRDYDLITAFRFFLNTEDSVRRHVMASLARRLSGPGARLVFNVHASATSSLALTSLYRRLRGWPPAGLMSARQARRLAEDAGLHVEACLGFALWPHRLYRGRLGPAVRAADRRTAGWHVLRPIAHDLVFVCSRPG